MHGGRSDVIRDLLLFAALLMGSVHCIDGVGGFFSCQGIFVLFLLFEVQNLSCIYQDFGVRF